MRLITFFSFCIYFLLSAQFVCAQSTTNLPADAVVPGTNKVFVSGADTPKKYNPNIAIKRSLILPGWGQYTNKKYWKIPIIYGALGTTGFIFFKNLSQYKDAKQAFILATDNDPTNDFRIKEPYFSVKDQPQRIQSFRNAVRQNVDYSVLFFIAFWGLNVADAAVDAHLKTFDVSDNLSLQFKPGHSEMANTNGLSLVLNIGK